MTSPGLLLLLQGASMPCRGHRSSRSRFLPSCSGLQSACRNVLTSFRSFSGIVLCQWGCSSSHRSISHPLYLRLLVLRGRSGFCDSSSFLALIRNRAASLQGSFPVGIPVLAHCHQCPECFSMIGSHLRGTRLRKALLRCSCELHMCAPMYSGLPP